jgi:hypothetical protein
MTTGTNALFTRESHIRCDLSRSDKPVLWESGGGMTNTGEAQIVCAADGSPLVPVYIKRSGGLVGGEHAQFVIFPGMVVTRAEHHRGDFTILISRLTGSMDRSPRTGSPMACLETLATFAEGQWDTEDGLCPERLVEAVSAAQVKATCYHCREPHFYAMPKAVPA